MHSIPQQCALQRNEKGCCKYVCICGQCGHYPDRSPGAGRHAALLKRAVWQPFHPVPIGPRRKDCHREGPCPGGGSHRRQGRRDLFYRQRHGIGQHGFKRRAVRAYRQGQKASDHHKDRTPCRAAHGHGPGKRRFPGHIFGSGPKRPGKTGPVGTGHR